MTEILSELPSSGGLYAKALGTLRRKPGDDARVPQIGLGVDAVSVSSGKLADYRDICGFEADGQLPIIYPQMLAQPLTMAIMLRPEFPLPLVGLVHLRNVFEQLAPMPEEGRWNVRVTSRDGRRTHQGIEADFLTEFQDEDGQLVYRATMTVLHRMKRKGPRPPKPAPPAPGLAEYRHFSAPADIGRRYARVSGDHNPIHLHPLTARMLGFPRAIAHGMWSLARTTALLEQALGKKAARIDMQFRQPLFLPGKVAVRFAGRAEQTDFQLLSRTSDKVHFSGSLRSG